jgi:Tfp pilus assembly protein PilZ
MQKKTILIIEVDKGTPVPEHFLNLFQFEKIDRILLRNITPDFKTDIYDFVLYACDCIDEKQLHWLLPMARRTARTQYLILTEQVSIHAYRQVAIMENIITLQLPLSDDLLRAMVNQLGKDKSMASNQRLPRFITDEPVRMVVMETGLLIPSRMKNYSVTGAFIEYKGINLRVGHNLKVNMHKQEDPESKKPLQLDGRVVWIRSDEARTGASVGIGVQFSNW